MVKYFGKTVSKYGLKYYEQSQLWFYGGNFHVIDELKADICKNCPKFRKSAVWGQNDVIGSKWWKFLGKKLFQNNLLSIINNLYHGFMG